MNPRPYIKGFACISIIALSGLIFPGCVTPMLVGAALAFWLLHKDEPVRTPCSQRTTRQSLFGTMGGRRFGATA